MTGATDNRTSRRPVGVTAFPAQVACASATLKRACLLSGALLLLPVATHGAADQPPTPPLPLPLRQAAVQAAARTNAGPGALRPGANAPGTPPHLPGQLRAGSPPGGPPGSHPSAPSAVAAPGARTNKALVLPTGPKPAPPALPGHPGANTNAAALTKAGGTNTSSGLLDNLRNLPNQRAFYPAVALLSLCLGALFLFRAFKPKPTAVAKTTPPPLPSKVGAPKRKSPAVIHSCNVVELGVPTRVWQFDARNQDYVLNREHTCLAGDALPAGLVAKDWRALFQHKLNIAWLPSDQVFLRVVQLPKSDFEETLAMVELQLEKLSPLPIAQIAWSLQLLPHAEGELQSVIVLIVARSVVEEFLGRLLADRLELPLLDQLHSTAITGDGAWIYPDAAGGKDTALVAWWYGGVLQNLGLLALPQANQAASLKEQLMQMAWAGELEGWLTSASAWHLVADSTAAASWEPPLRQGLEQTIDVITPLSAAKVASLTARRAAQADIRGNLLPPEFAARYRQQYVDRFWMRSLAAVFLLYTAGVVIYLACLGVLSYRTSAVKDRVAAMSLDYTNAIQLRDKLQVLKDRQELEYASLQCWHAAAKLLPDTATLDSLIFSDGRTLALSGTAPSDQIQPLLDFEHDLRRNPLFDPNKGDNLQFHRQGQNTSWNLRLELRRSEAD